MYTFDRSDINYLKRLLLKDGELQILPFDILKDIPQEHISQFCVENGCYLIPTTELVEFLAKLIGGNESRTIEIGSGNGVLGKALGIMCTDNFQQAMFIGKMTLATQTQGCTGPYLPIAIWTI